MVDSPLTEILKCVKPNVDMQAKSNEEVKQLTFIKINKSNQVEDSKMIKFCIACTVQSGSQCILSRKPFLWIVFSFKSDAQDCLSKVQIMYPHAAISDPPVDLNLKCFDNLYFVGSCQEMVTNGLPFNVVSPYGLDDTDWNIFFHCNSDFIAPMVYYEPTKWSHLYNLFEKLYDLGAKKVIFDGNLYCVNFDSASAHQQAFEKIHSCYLEPLEPERAPEIHKQRVTKRMNRYSGIPWCLTQELGLSCLVIKIESQFHDHFIEISKSVLGNRECIFIKSTPGEIWIGFSDELICKDSEKTVNGFLARLKQSSNVSIAKPSNELLESINFQDLAGDAYDLAFLSSQLKSFKPITRPNIIERIRMQRMQEHDGSVFSIIASGKFHTGHILPGLVYDKIFKIFVKLSKVIPLAGTTSWDKVTLIYNSWHEAHAARHYINKWKTAEVPYFAEFHGASHLEQKQLACSNFSEYCIINDKRKVLEKIVQNKSLVDKLDSNSSTAQSTSEIGVLDEEMKMKLQYLFAITTNSEFELTSGMISIIKMHLVSMNCLACIEFEDKIWVAVEDLEKGKKAKAQIEKIKFKMLNEYEDDFNVGVVMESIQKSQPKVTKMLANKLMNPKKSFRNMYLDSDVCPLGHFNYSYRKAAGMSTSRYCQLNGSSK
uniref:Uncharacterized protein n=1 Tax=Tetranychus urticae TaxID=32264 RepID=T1KGI7_TETUR